jgi:group I intron endonuclease
MGYIYLVTNKINGKRYVGQTQQMDIETRWRAHRSMSPTSIGKYLLSAYKKYGIPNFKFQIICICFNEDCDRYEEEYIKKFNTIGATGYNILCRGNSVPISEETRQLISKGVKESMTDERRKAISDRNKGRIITDEQRKLISRTHTEMWQNMTQEKKDNIIQTRKANPNYQNAIKALLKGSEACKKRVGKYDTNNNLLQTFESVSHAARETNIKRTTISSVCLQKPSYKTAGGFVWKFI